MSRPRVAVAATGVANLASVLAVLARAGAEASPTSDPDALADADLAFLPGVGAFGPAMERLRSSGLDRALALRWERGAPTVGACLGMQLFFEASEESPGVRGLGLLPGKVRRLGADLPLPQLGWNRVGPADSYALGDRSRPGFAALEPGWAYFANSYVAPAAPEGCRAFYADYGGPFVAALEAGGERGRPSLVLCQFHPELSGRWGLELVTRFLALAKGGRS